MCHQPMRMFSLTELGVGGLGPSPARPACQLCHATAQTHTPGFRQVAKGQEPGCNLSNKVLGVGFELGVGRFPTRSLCSLDAEYVHYLALFHVQSQLPMVGSSM